MFLAAFFEGMGVTLLLPILQIGGAGDLENPVTGAVSTLFEKFHIEYSLNALLLILVIFFLIRSVFLLLHNTYVGKIQSDLLVKLRYDTISKVFNAKYRYLLQKGTGYLNNAITVEFQNVSFAFKMFASVLVKIAFSVLYLILPLMLNFMVAVLVGLVALPVFFIMRKVNKRVANYSVATSSHSAELQSFLIQALSYFKYFKATHSYQNILKKIFNQSKELGKLIYKQTFWAGFVQYGFEPFIVLVMALIIFYHVKIVGGEIVEIAFILILFYRAGSQLLGIPQSYRKFLMSIGSINVFTNLEKELEQNAEELDRGKCIPDFSKPIVFDNVYFGYDDSLVLKNINLSIPAKSTVAFVGRTGSGKSTLFGEKNCDDIDQTILRNKIGYITQENVIFNDSIANNITLWNKNVSEEKMDEATKQAHIKDFVEGIPNRYDTLLGENGLNISGGERQRISIARELYKDVDILIFDEATSSLDSHTEKKIQQDIDEFRGHKTVILIAHRLSTIKNSDRIFVLKNGEIVEEGNYRELYNHGGVFRRMVEEQEILKDTDPL
jgi:subfamily B ATP-binding cassette protein MsbA